MSLFYYMMKNSLFSMLPYVSVRDVYEYSLLLIIDTRVKLDITNFNAKSSISAFKTVFSKRYHTTLLRNNIFDTR